MDPCQLHYYSTKANRLLSKVSVTFNAGVVMDSTAEMCARENLPFPGGMA